MTLIALGLNHTTAPLALRGRFAMPATHLPACLSGLRDHLASARPEAAILSTCNRTELYLAAAPGTPVDDMALDWLARQGGAQARALAAHTYLLKDAAAARHAFRVAAGLDSQILGEPQILGQLKQAMRTAAHAGSLGCTLHQLFQRSLAVAKQVRTHTEIGSHAVSLGAAAVRVAQQLFEDLRDTRVLCLGAGEMIERVAVHFQARQPRSLVLANRTLERGQALAARLQAEAIALAEVPARIHEFDVVVSCTASPLPLIGLGLVTRALKQRLQRPMLLLDLAVPSDIEPAVGQLENAYLYSLDDLTQRVQGASARRQASVVQAEALVDAGVRGFDHWLHQRDAVPLIQSLQRQADGWRQHELQRARRRLARGEAPDAVLDSLARGLTGKLLHGPLAALHHGGAEPSLASTLSRLFLGSH